MLYFSLLLPYFDQYQNKALFIYKVVTYFTSFVTCPLVANFVFWVTQTNQFVLTNST